MTAAIRLAGRARQFSSASLILGVLSLVCWVVAVRAADFSKMGEFGLISILDPVFFAGLALVAIAFALELLRTPLRAGRLMALIGVLVVFLFGTASAIEPVAGLTVSWVHSGYVLYILQHGHVLNGYNAEFSWPGGFSLGAVLVAFAGQNNALSFLRWFPLVIELLYLAPMLVIARYSGVGRRAGWLGVALFFSANWIYQDYFSPQALNYLFFLVVVAVVLAVWQPAARTAQSAALGMRERFRSTMTAASLRRLSGADAVTDTSNQLMLIIVGLLAVICLASAFSHQLTPYAMLLALLACLFGRRLGRPELILLVALFAVGWLSLGASNFWIGHLSSIFGSIGAFFSTYQGNVASRVTGSASHRLIVDVRILLTAGLFFVAGIGALRRRTNSRALEMLACGPFLLLAAQDYGGEGLLRVALFSLPFTSLLAASAIIPGRTGVIRSFVPRLPVGRHGVALLRITAAVAVFAVAASTVFVRGGNDAYESYSKTELAAVNYVYAHVRGNQIIAVSAPYLPIGQQKIDSSRVLVVADAVAVPNLTNLVKAYLKVRPHWVILSKSQASWGEIVASYPPGWQDTLKSALVRNGYQVVAVWPDAVVLQSTPVTRH